MPLDQVVIDLSWNMGSCIRLSVCRLSVRPFPLRASAIVRWNQWSTSFFIVPLPRVASTGSSPSCFSQLHWIHLFLFAILLFGFSSDELTVVPRVFVYLLFVLKYCIWSQRNDFHFHSVAPSTIGLLAGVKAHVRFHLPLFFKRFHSYRRRHYFLCQWGANGVICSIRNSSLPFNM